MSARPEVVRGAMRPYDWGVVDGLVDWGAAPDGGPQAELWFGRHPGAPSPLRDRPGTLLDAWADAPTPLLTKILAAATPLSIQVHPTAEVLREWQDDPQARALLADDAEKDEMLLAVRPFLCLVDWRPAVRARALLAAAGADGAVLAALDAGEPAGAARELMGAHRLRLPEQAWHDALSAAGADRLDHDAMAAVAGRFGDDPGVAVAVLLQPVRLSVADAVYVPAGVPHAYVHGTGVEVMRSSDNVIRLGLSSKTVSVPHALAALDSRRSAVVARSPASGRYNIPGAPFTVNLLSEGIHDSPRGRFRTVLALQGGVLVSVDGEQFRLVTGDALAVPAAAGDAGVRVDGSAVVVRERP